MDLNAIAIDLSPTDEERREYKPSKTHPWKRAFGRRPVPLAEREANVMKAAAARAERSRGLALPPIDRAFRVDFIAARYRQGKGI